MHLLSNIPACAQACVFAFCACGLGVAFGQEAPASVPAGSPELASGSTLLDVFQEARTFVDEAQDAPADAVRLGLAEVVQRAIDASGRLKAADELVVQRESQHEQTRAARRPTIGGQLQMVYLGGLQQDIEVSPISELIVGANIGDLGDALLAGSVSLQQVIYAGGRIHAGMRATASAVEAETMQRQAALTEIALEATRAYYEALLAKAAVRVSRESSETFERHLADANKALEVGAVSRFEVLRAQTELQTREADLLRASTLDELTTLNLRRLTGLEGTGPLYLEPDWFTAAAPTEAMEALVAEALETRPELGALEHGIAAAREQVKVKQADGKPKVAAIAQYQHVEGGPDFAPKGFLGSVIMQWDFYTGGKVKHQTLEAQSQVRQLEHQQVDLERAVELEVKAAWLQAKEAAQRILMQFATVQIAQEGQELADLRFQQGAGTQTETLDADLALSQARTALVQALGDYFIAQADLAKASGRGWRPVNVGAPEAAAP